MFRISFLLHFLLPVLVLGLTLPTAAWGSVGEEVPVFHQVAGEIRRIRVSHGDTLVSIAARVGMPWKTLADGNELDNPDRIYVGQELKADTRKIVPNLLEEGLVVNVPEATLYRFDDGRLASRHPAGLGRPHSPTPLGSFTVLHKEHETGRTPPRSLEVELRNESTVVRRKLTPDRDISLGPYWIQLSAWGYGVHTTEFRPVLGQFLGYGTIRVSPESMADLFPWVTHGTRIELSYHPVKIAITPAGDIWLEAHPDVYGLWFPTFDEVQRVLEQAGVAGQVDEAAVAEVLDRRAGQARKIGPRSAGTGEGRKEDRDGAVDEEGPPARWVCLDCPPEDRRRVTFQIQAEEPIDLPNPYPIRILDDARNVVFRPQMVAQSLVHLEPGQTRNFVWEIRSTGGQPLPAGSYVAVIDFLAGPESSRQSLSLPLWVGK